MRKWVVAARRFVTHQVRVAKEVEGAHAEMEAAERALVGPAAKQEAPAETVVLVAATVGAEAVPLKGNRAAQLSLQTLGGGSH